MTKISPSVLSADFLHLEKDIVLLNGAADYIHLDVMDGIFVPNISFGFPVIQAIAKVATIPLDAHLMIADPKKYFDRTIDLGVELLSFHLEAALNQGDDPVELLRMIRKRGVKAGLAINPDFPLDKLYPYLKDCDFVLCMTVFAGFGGQKIIDDAVSRIAEIRKEIDRQGLDVLIEVDGGVTVGNVASLKSAGAEIIVAGSTVFKAEDKSVVISALREA